MTKCIDPNYLNHIDKLKTVALRINVLCESQEQLISSPMNLKSNLISNLIHGPNLKLQLTIGCVFSQDEVREIIADRSLISNFTLELLKGTDKKCGTLNEIQMCFIETFEKFDDKEFSKSFKLLSEMILKSLNCKNQHH